MGVPLHQKRRHPLWVPRLGPGRLSPSVLGPGPLCPHGKDGQTFVKYSWTIHVPPTSHNSFNTGRFVTRVRLSLRPRNPEWGPMTKGTERDVEKDEMFRIETVVEESFGRD